MRIENLYAVYKHIAKHSGHASVNTIMKDTKLSRQAVSRATRRLYLGGLIETERHGKFYLFHLVDNQLKRSELEKLVFPNNHKPVNMNAVVASIHTGSKNSTQIAVKLGVSTSKIHDALAKLEKQKRVQRNGLGTGTVWIALQPETPPHRRMQRSTEEVDKLIETKMKQARRNKATKRALVRRLRALPQAIKGMLTPRFPF